MKSSIYGFLQTYSVESAVNKADWYPFEVNHHSTNRSLVGMICNVDNLPSAGSVLSLICQHPSNLWLHYNLMKQEPWARNFLYIVGTSSTGCKWLRHKPVKECTRCTSYPQLMPVRKVIVSHDDSSREFVTFLTFQPLAIIPWKKLLIKVRTSHKLSMACKGTF